ncbi:MAG: HAMP domain-containing sensor histidine kinase [Candidatus Nanopelagicales bacterium]
MSAVGSRLRTATGSLRSRLVVVVLAMTALGLVLAAALGTLLLRQHLVSQVDQQLAGAARFASQPVVPAPVPSPQGSQTRALPSPFVLTRLDAAGQVTTQDRGSQVESAPAPDLSGLTLAEVQARGSAPFDVGGIGDAAYSYRASAVPLADGSGSVVLAISTEAIDETTGRVTLGAVAVGLLILGLVGLLAGRLVGLGLRPLEDVERTAERIAAGDLAQRVPDMPEGTEIGRLADSLNGMLAQIESAFAERAAGEDRLRRFVADASHELRTPLTTIRGYAELTRSGAIGDDEARTRAVARIEEEAARMGALVDDLLLLARLDQHRPLDDAEVDLVALVAAAADALRAAAPDREVTVTGVRTAVVTGDAARLRQVLDNLATNARLHTAAGTPVSFGVEVVEDRALVSVSDAGPGMTAEEVARAFERFYRGDPSRTRATGGGTGLGLSIAQAIVAAQGGELALVSSPSAGTTVTVALPLRGGPTYAGAAGELVAAAS